jgi:hypothetical protein
VQDRGDYTNFVNTGGNTPCQLIPADAGHPDLRGLRIPTKEWLRQDLNVKCQLAKEGRRQLKRDYWDWASDPERAPLAE